mgnify:CR=1 FL=1
MATKFGQCAASVKVTLILPNRTISAETFVFLDGKAEVEISTVDAVYCHCFATCGKETSILNE